MRHDTLRYPVSFSVSMGTTSLYLCLKDARAAPGLRLSITRCRGRERGSKGISLFMGVRLALET